MCHKNLCSLFMWANEIKFMNIHEFSTENSSRENFPFSSIHTHDYRFFSLNNFGVVLCHSLIDCSIIVLPFLRRLRGSPKERTRKENTRIHFILICYLRFFSTKCVCVCFKCLYQHTRNQYPNSLHTSQHIGYLNSLAHALG